MLCGGCGVQLEKDSPIQVIELDLVKKKKFRGPCCANGPVPDDLPDAPSDSVLLANRVESIRAMALKVLTVVGREHLSVEPESALSPSVSRSRLSDLRVARCEAEAVTEWLPHPDD